MLTIVKRPPLQIRQKCFVYSEQTSYNNLQHTMAILTLPNPSMSPFHVNSDVSPPVTCNFTLEGVATVNVTPSTRDCFWLVATSTIMSSSGFNTLVAVMRIWTSRASSWEKKNDCNMTEYVRDIHMLTYMYTILTRYKYCSPWQLTRTIKF